MFKERLMDIVRKSIRDGYYTEEVEQLVDQVNNEIEFVLYEMEERILGLLEVGEVE